jgi:hypothetical protein
MKALRPQRRTTHGLETMNDNAILQKLREENANFQKTVEELYLLKLVAADLRNYRKMIKLKKYD